MTIILPTHGELNWDTTLNTALTRLDFQSTSPDVFNVKDHGAVGNGTTDDTLAIRSTISAAVAWAISSGTYDATVFFPSAVYLLSSAPVKAGTTKGNSQLPLPIIATTANKVTLRFKGHGDISLPHWQQTSPQLNGVILKSTYQEVMDNTNGECSVLGGPTPQQGYAQGLTTLFNNMCVVIDGIQIQTKDNHTNGFICGFDFRGMAEAHVIAGSVFTDQGPPTITHPGGTGYEFGLAMPFPANNAYCKIDAFAVEGFTYGAWLTEHCIVTQITAVYCFDGLVAVGSYQGSGSPQHNMLVLYACIEACTNAILLQTTTRVTIIQLDVENITGLHVRDVDGTPSGYIGLTGIISSLAVDPTNVEVIYIDSHPGSTSAPAVPVSGVAFRNPKFRKAAVYVNGGTVSAVDIDGVTTGQTSGLFILPSGKSITLTYSVAPTWTWTLL